MEDFWQDVAVAAVGPVLTTLLAVFVVNWLTRRWQNRQRALEIRTELVGDVSEAVMDIVLAVQFVYVDHRSGRQEDLDDAYRTWEVRRAVLGTRLEAYFEATPVPGLGGRSIPDTWDRFAELVASFHALEGTEPEVRPKRQQELCDDVNDALRSLEFTDRIGCEWGGIRDGLLLNKKAVIRSILVTPMSVLQ